MIDKNLFVEYQKQFGKWYSFSCSTLMTDEEINEEIQACIDTGLDQHDYRFRYNEKEAEEAIRSRDIDKLEKCYYKKFKTSYNMFFYTKNKEWMIDELIECLESGRESENLPWEDDPYNNEWIIPSAYREKKH